MVPEQLPVMAKSTGYEGSNSAWKNNSPGAEVYLYPNPNNGRFTVHIRGTENPTRVSVYDAQGKKIV